MTPVAVEWWPDGRMNGPAEIWTPTHPTVPQSDPAPTGPTSDSWQRPPGPWSTRASYAAAHLGNPTLTVTRADGYPSIVATSVVDIDDRGFRLTVPEGIAINPGPACLTFDRVHGVGEFLGQENAVFTGTYSPDEIRFEVDRLLPDFSLPSRGSPNTGRSSQHAADWPAGSKPNANAEGSRSLRSTSRERPTRSRRRDAHIRGRSRSTRTPLPMCR